MSARTAAISRRDEDRQGAEPVPGYHLLARVGSGGAGDVWCAEAPGGLRVALKIVQLAGGLGRKELANLRILRAIRHPNLLVYFGAWRARGRLIIGMELADRSLWDRFAEARGQGLAGIPLGELLDILGEVAKVVDFLNEPCHDLEGRSGVAIHHRDIKPQNIMLIGRGVKVADFGLSCLGDPAGASWSQCGLTFAYAAPEAFRRQIAASSDQYSLAVTYCQMRGGRLPFVGPPAAVMMGHLFGDPDLSMLPGPERPIVRRAMAKNPSERWPDCQAFVTELVRCAQAGVPDSLPGVPDGPEPSEVSSCSVEIPGLPVAWDGSISVASNSSIGREGATGVSAYCLDLAASSDAEISAGDADSSEPTVVVAEVARLGGPKRPTTRLLIAAASILLAGLAAWSWSTKLASRAAVSSSSGSRAIQAKLTRVQSASQRAANPSQGRSEPLVHADSSRPAEPPTSGPSGKVATARSSSRSMTPAPPPPIPAWVDRPERAVAAPTPVPIAIRLADLSAWTPRIRKATATARTWLASARAARRPEAAPRVVAPKPQVQPPPPAELRVGMPEVLVVEAGRSVPLPIRVNRAGHSEPLSVHFEGLPAGVEIPDLTIPPGQDRGKAMARIRLDTPAVTTPVTMVLGAGSIRARAPFRLQVKANPAMLQRTRGHTLLACGRPAEAVAAFTEALQAGVSDPCVYNNRGLAYWSLNQLDLAIRDFTEAVRLRPADATMHYNRGLAFARRGDDFRALLDFDTAIRLKPDYIRAFEARAQVYRRQGDMVRSCADSGRASELARAARPEGQPPEPRPPQSYATSGPGRARSDTDPASLSR